ncbi:MAG: exopolysaccharide biosynthesis protein [Candidatus Scalindua brodae]|uniref:Exopolysaccharide biosynthesis protein n=1 Tax=Candidatus Scalindua brodae TaxID=237368 RepID=A0A0B0ELJ4_9BACT|nr:MAG: exopolysaccharide biosynthesis protein [Candidatus Scalindua brodae]
MWIIPTIIFGIGGVVYALKLPDIYESKCVMSVEKSEVFNNLLPDARGERSSSVVLESVRARMLGWQSVVQVIRSVGLDKGIPQDASDDLEGLYRELVKEASFRTKGKDLIEVAYRGENPETTFRVVDGLVANFMEQSLKLTRNDADETVDFIEEDLKRLKRDLDEAERLLREFEEKHLDELPGSENSKMSKLAAAERELVEINGTLMILNEKNSFIEEKVSKEAKTMTGEIVRIPNPRVNELNKHINDLEIELTTLRAKYFDEHPSIVMKQKSLKRLKEMLEREEEKVVSEETVVSNPLHENMLTNQFQGQLEIKSLQRRRKELEKKIATLTEAVSHMPSIKQNLTKLVRGYDVSKEMYQQRLMQKSRADLMREMSLDAKTNPYNIVEPPRVSYEPIKSVKLKIMAMGVFLGAGLGIGLIIGLDTIDTRFKTMDEIQEYLSIPALGVVPLIVTNTDVRKQVRKKIIVAGSLAILVITTACVCLIVPPVRNMVSDKAAVGWNKLSEIIKK